jgi:opacity protein-like surface antigen
MGWINIENGGETEEWSQEVRFTSQQDQQLRYALGAYYFNVNVDAFPGNPVATTQIPADYTTIGVGPIASGGLAIGSYIFGGSVLPGGAIDPLSRIIANEEEEGWSVFGSMDYDFGPTEQWTAGAEIRYSQDTKDITTYDYEPCGNPDVLPFNTDTCKHDWSWRSI